jgi:hypothetical protein
MNEGAVAMRAVVVKATIVSVVTVATVSAATYRVEPAGHLGYLRQYRP